MTVDKILNLALAVQDLLPKPKPKPEPEPERCPHCDSPNHQNVKHYSYSMGDVYFKRCDDCDFEWDHT